MPELRLSADVGLGLIAAVITDDHGREWPVVMSHEEMQQVTEALSRAAREIEPDGSVNVRRLITEALGRDPFEG